MDLSFSIDPEFERLFAGFLPDSVLSSENTIYGLWPDLTLACLNLGWNRFADLNGGQPSIARDWTLGRNILGATPLQLRSFFSDNYHRCLREGRPWKHTYECSSAEHFRKFVMTTFPLGDGGGLLVVNSLVREVSHTAVACDPLEDIYRNDDDLVIQCCHCRRVLRAGSVRVWDWVPVWVKSPPKLTSHGLCEPCRNFYYSHESSSNKSFPAIFTTGASTPL